MSDRVGDGAFIYREDTHWARLPRGWSFREVADVAVDSRDRVFVFCRGEHPVIIFDRDGNFLDSWGDGMFHRPHGLTIGPDDSLYCVDDLDHSVRKFSPDGKLLLTLGERGRPAPRHSGLPFNQPTKAALEPGTGAIYVADGYGNAAVHKFSPEGDLMFSWGRSGTDPGEFNPVHSVCTDQEGRVYVADRESHRIQIFDPRGRYITQWNNMHRPCGLHISREAPQRVYIGELPPSLAVNMHYPRLGARLTVHDLEGRRLAAVGADTPGEEKPGQFIAPHGMAVDSRGDLYLGEVAYTFFGAALDPPREPRCLRKLTRQG